MVRFSASKLIRGALCAVALYYAYTVWSRDASPPTEPNVDSEALDVVVADDHIINQIHEEQNIPPVDEDERLYQGNDKEDGVRIGQPENNGHNPNDGATHPKKVERAARWQPPSTEELKKGLAAMRNNLKIYVYDIESYEDKNGKNPLDIQSTQCGIGTGHNKGYGVERYFVEMLRRSPYVTTEATDANLFLIPVIPCAAKWEHTNKKISKQQNHEIGKKFSMDYVTAAVTYVSKMWPYLSGSRPQLTAAQKGSVPIGADHFWFSTHDGGATRAWGAPHNFINNSIALVNTADEVMDYKPCWDVSLPCNCDFDRPPKPSEHDVLFSSQNRLPQVFFAGNLGSNALRQTIAEATSDDDFFQLVSGRMEDEDYTRMLRTSTFCLHLRGFQVWSPRLIEYLWFGCIPVVLGDDYYLPYSALFDWDKFSIRICEGDAGNIKEILTAISPERINDIRSGLRDVVHHFTFHNPPQIGDAFEMAVYQLSLRSESIKSLGRGEELGLCDRMQDECVVPEV